jgi:hypothetical protein
MKKRLKMNWNVKTRSVIQEPCRSRRL